MYVILPGIDNSLDGHWQSEWQHGWGDRAVRLEVSSWAEPDLEEWLGALSAAVAALPEPPVLIAHSAGSLTAAEWLRRGLGEVQAALLVAAPDVRSPAFPQLAPTFLPLRPGPLGCPALLVYSDTDPFASTEASLALAEAWGADSVSAGEAGHINPSAGFGPWPQGLELLADLERRA
jgi:predicted alpha/beta hydrolase family esterase